MIPTDIKLRQKSKKLELVFEGGESYSFAYEFLRVYSPSAEVRGHSPEQAVLQLNKVSVGVSKVDLIGNLLGLLEKENWLSNLLWDAP